MQWRKRGSWSSRKCSPWTCFVLPEKAPDAWSQAAAWPFFFFFGLSWGHCTESFSGRHFIQRPFLCVCRFVVCKTHICQSVTCLLSAALTSSPPISYAAITHETPAHFLTTIKHAAVNPARRPVTDGLIAVCLWAWLGNWHKPVFIWLESKCCGCTSYSTD